MSVDRSGLIVANLLAEEEWAGRAALPSRATRERLALAAALLAVFARSDADILWLPAPIAPEAATLSAGPVRPDIRFKAPESVPDAIVAWATTTRIDGLRRTIAAQPGPSTGIGWIDSWWRQPLPSPAIARRLASRAWSLALAERLGAALPGARLLQDASELAAHLGAGAAAGSPSGSWVLKVPWSAAGRERIVVPATGPSASQDRWLRRQFARGEGLLFEPWMARRADYGCVGMTKASKVTLLGAHRQTIDATGRFLGLTLWPGCLRPTEMDPRQLPPDAARRLEAAALAVGGALAMSGYEGPFGVDAWSYTLANGGIGFQAIGEVNVRCTMGLVARAWTQRLGLPPDGRGWRLRFGPALDSADHITLAEGLDRRSAWLEPC